MAEGQRRIAERFAALAGERRCALIPYLTGGYPTPDLTVALMEAMVRGGADLIELGIPFSDPMADGPVIQAANEQALAQGYGLGRLLEDVARFRQRDQRTPVVLMGYSNSVEAMGVRRFCERAVAAGIDGVLLVDCPPEEGEGLADVIGAAGLDNIFLVAPTSSDERVAAVGQAARGYVYYVSLKGVTGAGHIDTADVARQLERLRRAIRLPIGVGFGIRDGGTAAAIAGIADAVVIGTRVIQIVGDGEPDGAAGRLEAFVGEIRSAIDGVDRNAIYDVDRSAIDGVDRTVVDGANRNAIDGANRSAVEGTDRTALAGGGA